MFPFFSNLFFFACDCESDGDYDRARARESRKEKKQKITLSQSPLLILWNILGDPLILNGWMDWTQKDGGILEIKRSVNSRRFVRVLGSVFTGMENVELSITWMAAGEASA